MRRPRATGGRRRTTSAAVAEAAAEEEAVEAASSQHPTATALMTAEANRTFHFWNFNNKCTVPWFTTRRKQPLPECRT